jgi:8-oxo-dGTP pyrophosphatase MutT (NUDIX family)
MVKLTKQTIAQALLGYKKKRIDSEKLKPSAVLIPIFRKEGQYYLLFAKRSEKVIFHKGQLCFPGGTYEAYDTNLLQTALREAEEEIGLESRDAEVLGELDDCATRDTNYVISPFVAFIPYPYIFKLDGKEVEQILYIPLPVLIHESRQSCHPTEDEGELDPTYGYEGHIIWGATARILRQFIELLCSKE